MKTRFNLSVVIAAVFIFSFVSVSMCRAVDKFVFTPKLNGSWQTESNFFRAETGDRAVETFLIQPGLELGYETAKSLITLDATLDVYTYNDKDDVPPGATAASDFDYTGYTGILQAMTMPTERLKLGLDDSFTQTRDQAQSDRFNNAVDRDEFFINRLILGGYYEFNDRLGAGLRYRNQVVDYEKETREDSFGDRALLDLIYNLADTSLFNLNYQYWYLEYKGPSSDYISNQLKLVYRKQFQHFRFGIGAGYHNRDFEAAGVEDLEMPIYILEAEWQNPPGRYEPPVSFATLVWERNMNDLGYSNAYYKSHRVDLKAGHTFLEKIPVEFNGSYLTADYETFTGLTPVGTLTLRDDETLRYFLKAGYIFTDWLTIAFRVGREDRSSNLVGYNFTNDIFELSFESVFNFGAK